MRTGSEVSVSLWQIATSTCCCPVLPLPLLLRCAAAVVWQTLPTRHVTISGVPDAPAPERLVRRLGLKQRPRTRKHAAILSSVSARAPGPFESACPWSMISSERSGCAPERLDRRVHGDRPRHRGQRSGARRAARATPRDLESREHALRTCAQPTLCRLTCTRGSPRAGGPRFARRSSSAPRSPTRRGR